MFKSYQFRRSFFRALEYLFCVLLSLIVLVPFYISAVGGLKSQGQLRMEPLSLPNPAYWNQYGDMLTGAMGAFWQLMLNSLIIAAGTVFVTLLVCVLAAFALARVKFKGNKLIHNYFMLGLLFPLAIAILPLYLQIKNLGLIDNYLGVILPQVAFGIPMTVLLLRGFFMTIPNDLEDACAIDGYGPLGFLFHMVVPLSTPILATVAVLALVGSWNAFFLPLNVFNDPSHYTLPLGVMNFQGEHAANWQLILGYLTLAMVPAIILFVAAQRYIVAGLTGGAVKG